MVVSAVRPSLLCHSENGFTFVYFYMHYHLLLPSSLTFLQVQFIYFGQIIILISTQFLVVVFLLSH